MAKFCGRCGTRLDSEGYCPNGCDGWERPALKNDFLWEQTEEKRPKRRLGLVLAVILAVILLGVGAVSTAVYFGVIDIPVVSGLLEKAGIEPKQSRAERDTTDGQDHDDLSDAEASDEDALYDELLAAMQAAAEFSKNWDPDVLMSNDGAIEVLEGWTYFYPVEYKGIHSLEDWKNEMRKYYTEDVVAREVDDDSARYLEGLGTLYTRSDECAGFLERNGKLYMGFTGLGGITSSLKTYVSSDIKDDGTWLTLTIYPDDEIYGMDGPGEIRCKRENGRWVFDRLIDLPVGNPPFVNYEEAIGTLDSQGYPIGGFLLSEDEAREIARQYWDIEPGEVGEEGYLMSIHDYGMYIGDGGTKYYIFALRWLVEDEAPHWSTLEQIKVNIRTGECSSYPN